MGVIINNYGIRKDVYQERCLFAEFKNLFFSKGTLLIKYRYRTVTTTHYTYVSP